MSTSLKARRQDFLKDMYEVSRGNPGMSLDEYKERGWTPETAKELGLTLGDFRDEFLSHTNAKSRQIPVNKLMWSLGFRDAEAVTVLRHDFNYYMAQDLRKMWGSDGEGGDGGSFSWAALVDANVYTDFSFCAKRAPGLCINSSPQYHALRLILGLDCDGNRFDYVSPNDLYPDDTRLFGRERYSDDIKKFQADLLAGDDSVKYCTAENLVAAGFEPRHLKTLGFPKDTIDRVFDKDTFRAWREEKLEEIKDGRILDEEGNKAETAFDVLDIRAMLESSDPNEIMMSYSYPGCVFTSADIIKVFYGGDEAAWRLDLAREEEAWWLDQARELSDAGYSDMQVLQSLKESGLTQKEAYELGYSGLVVLPVYQLVPFILVIISVLLALGLIGFLAHRNMKKSSAAKHATSKVGATTHNITEKTE